MPEETHTVPPTESHSTPVVTGTAPKSSLGIPVAIVIAAALIAGAIVYTGTQSKGNVVQNGKDTTTQQTAEIEVAPVTKEDHIQGNPNAPIVIVEYSDYDCPFCRIFHDTMTKVMEEYGASGKVAWVYRHFPLESLHPNAKKISEASYCVSELGGNDAFWKFNNALNNSRKVEYAPDGNIKSVEPTNMERLGEFAVAGGVDKSKFETCYKSGKYVKKVEDDVATAMKTGARGTPYSFLVVGDQQGVINGAQPYGTIKQMIDTMIAQLQGAEVAPKK
jgi:protein-disulfide isomerase